MFGVLKKLSVATAFVIGLTGTASAVPVSLVFGDGDDSTFAVLDTPFVSYATAYAGFDPSFGGQGLRTISQQADGWGVDDLASSLQQDERIAAGTDASLLDNETLVLTFDRVISLDTLQITSFVDGTSNLSDQVNSFSIYVKLLGQTSFTEAATVDLPAGTTGPFNVDLSGQDVTGSVFALVATDGGTGGQGFKVAGFVGAAVPLPAAAPVLGGALLLTAFGLRRRRKR